MGQSFFGVDRIFSRWFQPWQKKRGHRRTGSQVAGDVSEGVWFASILLAGSFLLIGLLTSRVIDIPGLSSLNSGSGLWLSVLVLATFVLIGGGGFVWTVLRAGTSAERRKAITRKAADIELLASGFPDAFDFPTIPRSENLLNSPGTHLNYRLPCTTTSTWHLLTLAAFSLMWNGLLAAIALVMVNGFLNGRVSWLLLVVLVVMTIGAVRITGHFLAQVAKALRIGPTSVEVSDLPLYPGQRYDVAIAQAGRMSLKSIKLMLASDEKATFREGTDVRMETRRMVFQKVMQCESVSIEPGASFVHQGELVMPESIMHSFQSPSNAVQWKLVVQAETQRGDEFERVFPVVVFPSRVVEERD